MALNSSGPISLGGSTTGESINLELAQVSTTTISLNDSNVRTLAGVASGAITMPTDFWGKSSESFWICKVSQPSSAYFSRYFTNSFTPPVVLSDGSIIYCYMWTSSGSPTSNFTSQPIFVKISATGSYISASTISGVGGSQPNNNNCYINDIKLAPSGTEFYCAGAAVLNSVLSQSGAKLFKISTDLTTITQSSGYIRGGSGNSYQMSGLNILNDGNIIAGATGLGMITFNPTTLAFISNSATYSVFGANAKLSDGSFLVSSTNNSTIRKLDSSGNFVSGVGYGYTGYTTQRTIYNSVDDSHIMGTSFQTTVTNPAIIASNPSTFAFKWGYYFDTLGGTAGGAFLHVTQDPSGNIYAANTTGSVICKFTSSGSLVWQRSLTNNLSASSVMTGVTATNSGLYLEYYSHNAASGTVNNFYAIKLNPNGSGTGSYTFGSTIITYAVISNTLIALPTPSAITPATSTMYGATAATANTTYSSTSTTLTKVNV